MCLRINCWRYLISIFVVITVLISKSSQKKFSSPPLDVQYSVAVNNNDGSGFVPITHMRLNAKAVAPMTMHNDSDNVDSAKESKILVDKKTTEWNEDVSNDQQSISIRLRDLQSALVQLIAEKRINLEPNEIESNNRCAYSTDLIFNDQFIEQVKRFSDRYIFEDKESTGATSSGRVFLFKGNGPVTCTKIVNVIDFSLLLRLQESYVARFYWHSSSKNSFIGNVLAQHSWVHWKDCGKR